MWISIAHAHTDAHALTSLSRLLFLGFLLAYFSAQN
jgi:hypothetical protein